MFTVCYIERKSGDTPSIERVFRVIGKELERKSVKVCFEKVSFGNSLAGALFNLMFYRPPAADIYHLTGHINYMGLVLPRDRTFLTFHDLTVLEFRSGLRRWLIEKLFFAWPARRLKYLTAISEFTKNQLGLVEPGSIEKTTVVQNPVLVRKGEGAEFNSDMPTVLQIGTSLNKNVTRLVEALAGSRCKLRIIGAVSKDLSNRIEEVNIEFQNDLDLSNDELEDAYEKADIVALCSTHEGFGLPIIEAQAKRKVVLTSDRQPMKDVGGAGAVYVDPEDSGSIRSGLDRILSDSKLREHVIEEGVRNLERFAPERIASEYMSLYQKAIDRR